MAAWPSVSATVVDVADGERTFTEIARRAQIIDAAIEMIAAHGYADASFARIAERAGLGGAGVIGYYFASREDLDAEVVAEVLRRVGRPR